MTTVGLGVMVLIGLTLALLHPAATLAESRAIQTVPSPAASSPANPTPANPSPPVKARPSSPGPLEATPAGYSVKVTDAITDCAGHAYGRTKDWFEAQNCVRATRSMATGQVSGRATLFVTSRIQMASAEAAASVKQVLDESGTGNLNDLLREGRTFVGAPERMPASGYVSVQTGRIITVAEAGYADGGRSSNKDAALRAAAADVATLTEAQG